GPFTLKSAFQPIFAFRGERLEIAAFEGLIRPFRDGQGMSPGAFFRLVPAGDRLHVETLSRTLHLLNAGACLDPSMALFVNFDPTLVSDAELVAHALRDMRLVMHEAGIDPARMVWRDARHRRVLGLAAADRLDRRILDVVGRVEIRLAGTEADHVAAFGLQLP